MVPAHQHTIVVPLTRLKLLDRLHADNPGLPIGGDNDLLAGVCQDTPALMFVQHAVVVGAVGNDVPLISRHDVGAEIGAMFSAVAQTTVSTGADVHFSTQFEVL